jgi:hypothetical protein
MRLVEDTEKEHTDDGGFGWRFTVEDPRHNYPRAGRMALPQFRKRDKFALQSITNHMDNRDSTMKILRNMRSTGDSVRLYDIANELGKIRRAELGGKTRIQAMADFLENYSIDESGDEHTKFFQRIVKDDSNRATIVFFAHPLSFNITKGNCDVVQIDAT